MLEAVFYIRFHPARGPSVIYQSPSRWVTSHSREDQESRPGQGPLLSFQNISAYLIPPYDLCNRALSVTTNGHAVLGYPISLEDPKYERNRFTFNVCFVLREDVDARPWTRVVEKTAAFFTALEVEDGLLTAEEDRDDKTEVDQDTNATFLSEDGDQRVIHKILETIRSQLNRYGETCIRVSDIHVLNLRLETPPKPDTPPKVRTWDVPLLIRALPPEEDCTPDLTLQRIIPFLDGIKHISLIATQADVEVKLVKRGIRELLRHDYVIPLDLFHFAAIYTTTADFTSFVNDTETLDECRNYITATTSTSANPDDKSPSITNQTLIHLYTTLTPGLPLDDFTLTHLPTLTTHGIDIRRFITFGIIKSFLRRIHKYGLLIPTTNPTTQTYLSGSIQSKTSPNEAAVREFERAWKKAALSSGWATPPSDPPPVQLSKKVSRTASAHGLEEDFDEEEKERLRGWLDGTHCFDEICLAMKMTEKKLMERIRRSDLGGEVVLFNK
ncbi:Nitrogen permease regulator 2 [Recurvomyces mirabilis]|uniref:Nitrogen permease regulator 2 n=1 Tax=Recurvomyces mirabilis TaxID=574656 RepID=A0AAE0TS25_9PEZI|nr:Nitrogen permease regulator 2 [Recurvomyces mirabilis]KAK5155081.1 Nitrogen permease regulator 2 [Recurvomyces mirabilis]